MGAAVGIAILVGAFVAYIAYGSWLTKGIKPRRFVTAVPVDQVRDLFQAKVVRAGWKLVDDGNPMVAQSSLATGMRQQIGLTVGTAADGRTEVRVGPQRWITKYGVPKKAHTIRLRMNGFVDAVRAQDPSIAPVLEELRGR